MQESNMTDTPLVPVGEAAAGRRLDDSVLQTAGEAVLAEPTDGLEALGYESGLGYGRPSKGRAADFVAAHPVQSAVFAAVAGGLLMALLKSSLRGDQFQRARRRVVSRWR